MTTNDVIYIWCFITLGTIAGTMTSILLGVDPTWLLTLFVLSIMVTAEIIITQDWQRPPEARKSLKVIRFVIISLGILDLAVLLLPKLF